MNGTSTALYSFQDAAELDQSSQTHEISETSLMGNAALGSLHFLKQYITKIQQSNKAVKPRVIILCGPGNNGGDGLALAWFILGDYELKHLNCKIYITKNPKNEAALFYYNKLIECKVSIHTGENFIVDEKLQENDIIIEALLGTGQSAKPRGLIREILNHILKARSSWPNIPIFSLDIPAGLSEDSAVNFVRNTNHSDVLDAIATPDEIHCYGIKKACIALNASLNVSTICRIIPIGFHPLEMAKLQSSSFQLNHPLHLAWARRSQTTHKYKAGHGIWVGASAGMEGALIMSAKAFFNTGGGILHCFVSDKTNRAALLNALPALIIHSIADIHEIARSMPPARAILIGPGFGPIDIEESAALLIAFLKNHSHIAHIILDAAATQLINRNDYDDILKKKTLLTPHTGEWKRLNGPANNTFRNLQISQQLQNDYKCSVLVKDAVSVFLHNHQSWIFAHPNPKLAIAGSGDILAGILLRLFSNQSSDDIDMVALVHLAMHLHQCGASLPGYPNVSDILDNLSSIMES